MIGRHFGKEQRETITNNLCDDGHKRDVNLVVA